jgi:cytochrome c-type biogenesis protein
MTPGAITADPFGVLVAFGAGILSFLSPCVLPLVPGYLSMVSGLSAAELETGQTSGDRRSPPRLLRQIGLFVAGFTLVFVALGAAASGLGHLLGSHRHLLSVVSGAFVVLLGLVLLATALPASFWAGTGPRTRAAGGRLLQVRQFHVAPSVLGTWGAPVMGMAFAFAWTPCIGPVLGALTALAAARATLVGGVVLLLAYSLGLGVPFVLTGLAFGRLTTLYARARRRLGVVHLVSGVVLVAFGVLLLTDQLGWLASEMQALMRHIGLGRLSTS